MLVTSAYALLASALVARAAPSQLVFDSSAPLPSSSDLLATSASSELVASSTEDGVWTTFKHGRFPGHSIRARRPNFCEHVEEWSGYLDVEQEHGPTKHFYWHSFESRNKPESDPVQMWLNGGPGCSSFTGMLMELGPCNVVRASNDSPVTLEYNPWSWSSNATLLFLDQPSGVGFSYTDRGDKGVWSTEQAAVDVYAFVSIWFEAFSAKYGNAPFHMSGESYAGRYIPVFADYISQQNIKAASSGHRHINLESVLIGNGFTNPTTQYSAYYPTVCTDLGGTGPFVNETACAQMAADLPRCQALTLACAAEPSNHAVCKLTNEYCEATQTEPYYGTGRNAYDSRRFTDYPQSDWIDDPEVRHELGVDHEPHHGRDAPRKFIACSDAVGEHFQQNGDNARPSFFHVAHLLEAGVRVLIYGGRDDFICNWLGLEAWTRQLEWSGHDGFNAEPLVDWHVPRTGAVAGVFRTYGNLTFARIDHSGHFVPFDQPEASLAMELAWVHGGADGLKALR